MLEYRIVKEELVSPYIGIYQTYGIAAFERIGETLAQRAFVSDVSIDETFAASLAERCTAAQLDPRQLEDVVRDELNK